MAKNSHTDRCIGLSDDILGARHWTSLLTDTGSQMTNLGSRMVHLGNQHSKPEGRDISQVMQLGSRLMHVGSLFLEDTYDRANPSVAATPSKRRPSAHAEEPNKRNRFSSNVPPQPKPASFQTNPLTRFSASPGATPSLNDADVPDVFPVESDDELNEHDWSVFCESFGRSSFVMNDVDAVNGTDEPSTNTVSPDLLQTECHAEEHAANTISSSNKSRKRGEGKYLAKLVANTHPKMTLKTYFEQHDGNLICLCGRGAHNKHPGNKSYRDFVSSWSQDYRLLSKEEKEQRTNAAVREFESHGRRIFKVNGEDEWEELGQESARATIRAKISQRFRDSRE